VVAPACLTIILAVVANSPATAQQDTIPQDAVPRDTIRTAPDTIRTHFNSLERDLVGNALLNDAFPGSWGIPGTNSRIGVFGFIKVDYLQDIRPNNNQFEFTIPTIPLKGTPESNLGGRANIHAKQSRMQIDLRNITAQGKPMQAFVSWDFFFDDPDQDNFFRLRMAYGVWGNLLAGQTWSTFADLTALIETIDFEGGDALIGNRSPQFRYTSSIGDRWSWAAAIEKPLMQIDDPLSLGGETRASTPELIGRLRWKKARNHVQLTALVNQLRFAFDDGSGSATSLRLGGNLTGKFVFGRSQRTLLGWGVAGGRGMATFSPTTSADNLDAAVNQDGELEVIPFLEYNVGLRQYWLPNLFSAVTWAFDKVWPKDFQDPDTFAQGASFHINLEWNPPGSWSDNAGVYRFTTGVEYMWGYWDTMSGTRSIADRFQAMVKWKFR
jgi:hypothetical protein